MTGRALRRPFLRPCRGDVPLLLGMVCVPPLTVDSVPSAGGNDYCPGRESPENTGEAAMKRCCSSIRRHERSPAGAP